jgi:hypothetical protein
MRVDAQTVLPTTGFFGGSGAAGAGSCEVGPVGAGAVEVVAFSPAAGFDDLGSGEGKLGASGGGTESAVLLLGFSQPAMSAAATAIEARSGRFICG